MKTLGFLMKPPLLGSPFRPMHPAALFVDRPQPPWLRPQEHHHSRRNRRAQAAIQMRNSGMSLNEIARQLNLALMTVRGYIDDPPRNVVF